MKRVLVLLALTACAGGADYGNGGVDANPGDAGASADAGFGCALLFDPIEPVASSILPVRAYTSLTGVDNFTTFMWTVEFGGNPVTYTQEQADNSQIGFFAPTAGPYLVTVVVTGSRSCYDQRTLNVSVPGANADVFRLRTVPAPNIAPPQETFIQVKGGADLNRAIALDSGIAVAGMVKNSVTNAAVPAYLKFMPTSMPTAFTEVFAPSSGMYSLRLLPLNHDVLVIPDPSITGVAPRLVPWTAVPFTTELLVRPGTVVTGTVHGPSGAGFGGAKVQLYANNVPSTLATTAADGSFSVRTDFPMGATNITVKVTPGGTSGLPRLEATSTFNLGQPINVNYAASLATCDLGNTPVRRGATNQPNAQVTVVGSLAMVAGTISGVNATNTVVASATADGTGKMPSLLVPRGTLTAVTKLSMTDHAASALDTSACNVASIDAPAMTAVNGTTKNPAMTAISGIRIEAEASGMLALAGVPPIQITSAANGTFALPLAGGGRYNVRFADPQQRVAPLVVNDVAPLGVPTNALMPKALTISGEVSVVNNSNAVIGASVQLLCATCSGLDITRPIAETATDTVSRYRLAVPDPGTM